MPRSLPVLVLLTCLATPAEAQQRRQSPLDDEIARQTFELLGQQIGAVLTSIAEARASVAEVNADIAAARRRFWAEYDAGRRNGPAEAEFGRTLLAKDLGMMSISVGAGPQASPVKGLAALAGQVDGGIPEVATPAFEAWVNSIRHVLGASGPGSVVIATPTQLMAAVEKTKRWYDVYRPWRDWAEFTAHGINRPRPNIEWPTDEEFAALRPSRARPVTLAGERVVVPAVGYPLLQCDYVGTRENGSPIGTRFHFWHEKVLITRAQAQAAIAANPQSPLTAILVFSPGEVGLTECPKSVTEAGRLNAHREGLTVEGKWNLRRDGGDAMVTNRYGGSMPRETLTFTLNGKRLMVYALGQSWLGVGEFDGRKGHYEYRLPNGALARTEIVLDENGVLHGKVRGAGVADSDFVGERERR